MKLPELLPELTDGGIGPGLTDGGMGPGLGSPSPWAAFDSWGDIAPELSAEDMSLLDEAAVQIPWTDADDVPPVTDILSTYKRHLSHRSSVHLGYPYNFVYDHEELSPFLQFSLNNLGDPFIASNYGVHSRQFEVAVIDFFAKLWNIDKPDYWGYVTTCGTEGNLHAMLLARECHPDGIIYASKETHYSIFKAAKYYKMEAKAIPTLPMGEIDYDALTAALAKNRDKHAIINVNIGTTVKGAVDNLDRILRILSSLQIPRERFHIHCDGALFALMMPFVEYAPKITFDKPIDSIAVSGHKMLGCPMPCGVALTRMEHVKKVETRIEYLNSVDTTIMGSRNGQAPLHMWYALRKKGVDGLKAEVLHCINTAAYLRDSLQENGIASRLNDLSCTVVMERPMDDSFVKRWQLACETDIAHVVVMPNVTKDKVDKFVKEFSDSIKQHGQSTAVSDTSPLSELRHASWGGT